MFDIEERKTYNLEKTFFRLDEEETMDIIRAVHHFFSDQAVDFILGTALTIYLAYKSSPQSLSFVGKKNPFSFGFCSQNIESKLVGGQLLV